MSASSLPALRLIVFDWDGTVVNSIAHIAASWTAAFKAWKEAARGAGAAAGFDIPPEQAIKECIGLSVDATIAKNVPGASAEEMADIRTRYGDLFRAGAGAITAFDHAIPSLERLKADGFLLAVATGKSRRGLDRELGSTSSGHLFVCTRTADETTSKPHPQMLLELLEESKTCADHAVMIGDSVLDLMMAANGGVQSIAVGYGAEPAEVLQMQPGCIHCATDWPDLYSFITSQFRPLKAG